MLVLAVPFAVENTSVMMFFPIFLALFFAPPAALPAWSGPLTDAACASEGIAQNLPPHVAVRDDASRAFYLLRSPPRVSLA